MTTKTILITGASSGIGEAAARHLAQLGHRVALGARRLDRIQSIAEDIPLSGGKAIAIPLDVTSLADMRAFVAQAEAAFGEVDVLVNNAGVMPLAPMSDVRVDEWNRMIDVNLRGVLNGVAAVLPTMTERKSGHIINIGSVSSYRVDPTAGVYAATKFAVRAVTEGLRQESRHVRATMISPGLTRTELFDGIAEPGTRAFFKDMLENTSISSQAIAEAIAFAISQPADVDINELIVRPTTQG
ncbi:SDR family oxidoreductase [Mesorhizobium sangaii]|uniref:NADP-dependent 3-hydroxy acid dehydrogenase YdfG n=1 Tax=Mesorhizobium sangaii TaxID=505389 RepID=A0A841NXH7_9HYPH|nr:SDR family oxidoreductase [Mesorhizobium sangaii]MBB6407774.1 NADP-dependent 3-hydroxy acid dehydrogenase YdfG [Mesorhizobium sangaii]